MPNEPQQEFLRRRQTLRWLRIPRSELEDLAMLHPEIIYRKCKGAHRYFRKAELKQVLAYTRAAVGRIHDLLAQSAVRP